MYDGFIANKTFWTDSNGLEMIERKINPTGISVVSQNYYPITSAIAMRDFSKDSNK